MNINNIPPLLRYLLPAKTNLLCVLSLALVMLLSACSNSSLSFRTNMSKSALGSDFGIFVKDDGTVWTWGSNLEGRLGIEGLQYAQQPVQIEGLAHIRGVMELEGWVFAVAEDGGLWMWGALYGVPSQHLTPVRIAKTENVVDVFDFRYDSFGIKTATGAFIEYRIRPNGVIESCYIHRDVADFVDVVQTGDRDFTYLKTDGSVWSYAPEYPSYPGNISCEVSSGDHEPVGGIENIISISRRVNDDFMFLTNDGNVLNHDGEPVAGLQHIAQIAGTDARWVALTVDGQVYVSRSLVPDTSFDVPQTDSRSPVLLDDLRFTVQDISAGVFGFVLIDDKNVAHAFGRVVKDPSKTLTPQLVVGLPDVQQMSAGKSHALALGIDGRVWGWGDNRNKQISNSNISFYEKPVVIDGLTGIASVHTGAQYSVALSKTGVVWTWGYPESDSLLGSDIPKSVSDIPSMKMVGLAPDHVLALSDDGEVWAWGVNDAGQLGDGTLIDRDYPVRVVGLGKIQSIVASYRRSVALDNDGGVWLWGDTDNQFPGAARVYRSTIPAQVQNLPGMESIAAGLKMNLALDTSGHIWSWGLDSGRVSLGRELPYRDGLFRESVDLGAYPEVMPGLPEIVSVYSTGYSSVAIDVDHHFWTWGLVNPFLESPQFSTQRLPVEIVTQDMVSISMAQTMSDSSAFMLGLDAEGRGWSWGVYENPETCCILNYGKPYMSFRLN